MSREAGVDRGRLRATVPTGSDYWEMAPRAEGERPGVGGSLMDSSKDKSLKMRGDSSSSPIRPWGLLISGMVVLHQGRKEREVGKHESGIESSSGRSACWTVKVETDRPTRFASVCPPHRQVTDLPYAISALRSIAGLGSASP